MLKQDIEKILIKVTSERFMVQIVHTNSGEQKITYSCLIINCTLRTLCFKLVLNLFAHFLVVQVRF